MLKKFLYILVTGLLVSTYAYAQSPIDGQIDDPAYVELPKAYTPENKNNLSLYFNIDNNRCREFYGNNYYSSCRPRLGLEGKPAISGISLSPAIQGEWRWDDDYRLTFTPDETWLAGQDYIIEMDLDALYVPEKVTFPDNRRTAKMNVKTAPLNIDIRDMRYMQDPNDPQKKLVTAQLDMNYPIKAETLKGHMELFLEKQQNGGINRLDQDLNYELQFQPNDMQANLAVHIDTLPKEDHFLHLTLNKGIEPKFGGSSTIKPFRERTRVPSLRTYLAVNSASAAIMRNENGMPKQILSLDMNVKTKPNELFPKLTAYLLPAQHPVMGRTDTTQSDTPYQWRAENEVTSSILEQSEPVTLMNMPNGDEYFTQFGFGFQAPADRYLYISVDPGLEAFGGYTLEQRYTKIVKAPSPPHDIEIMQEGSILSLSGAKKLSLHARGTDNLKIEVAQILPQALAHFISQTQGDIRTPSFRHWSFDKEDIAHIETKNIKMAYVSPYESQYASFDFAPYLNDDRKGIFLLNIQGQKDKQRTGDERQRFILVTDIGMLIKQNANQTRDVFLTSYQTGQPVQEAHVTVLGQNGLEIFEGQTNQDGHLTLPDFSGYERDRRPVAIIAKQDNDYAFIPYEQRDRALNTSRFDVGGTYIAAQGLNAFLFSDRGIYRPGETAHIGMIVKNADWQILPEGLPLKAVITDPTGRIVKEKQINFSSIGLEEISLDTEKNWPTGTYFTNLYISNDGQRGSQLGSTSIRVEEFEPDRLKISTEFIQNDKDVQLDEGWLKPNDLFAQVTLQNLYGTAASNRKVKASVTLNPALLSFTSYPEYTFFDPYAAKHRSVQYDLPRTETDANGTAKIALNLEEQEPMTSALNLETTGYEAGSGKGVTSYSTALISPMEYVIGYNSNANLGYLNKGKDYSVQLIALDPLLTRKDVQDLSLTRIKQTYISTLVKRRDGSYVYESTPKEEEIETTSFSISSQGTQLSLPTNELGEYIYRITDRDGLLIADIPFSVAGQGQHTSGIDKEAVLKVKANKSDYAAGETIELNITAPYTGAGLITLESDHVLAYKWFKTDKTETLETISIPEDFAGKGYVNVAFLRNINSREIYLSPLSNAIIPFTANTDSRRISIDLGLPDTAKPGEPLNITYTGNKTGKAIIFAVDEGILQVAQHETPDPVDYFLLNRALQVNTMQMLDLLMPEFALIKELSADGGGMALQRAMMGKHLNPFRRQILASAVYWSGIVDLDEQEKTISFTPPGHFNGTLRIMAVAVGDQSIGSTEQDITVRSDLVLTPNMPLFLAPGDEAQASVTIANGKKGSGENTPISLSLTPSKGLKVITPLPEEVTIAENTEKSFTFTVKATDELGGADFTINAQMGDVKQSAKATLSIRPVTPLETTLQTEYTRTGKASLEIKRKLYDEFAQTELSVSALPSAYISSLMRYLDNFPYGCTEQITSRIYPQLALMNRPEFNYLIEKFDQNITEVVGTLRSRQTPDGGFSLWNNGYESHDFISIYAMDFLTSAKEATQPVPQDMVQRGLNYLRNWANSEITSMNDARNKAYAIYILTRNGIVTTNEILHWLRYFNEEKSATWQTDLAAVYIAASYEMMQQKQLAKEAMDMFEEHALASDISYKHTNWQNPYYNPFIKYAVYVSLLAKHFPDRLNTLDPDIIFKLADFLKSNRYNTLSASFAIQAISNYATKKQDDLTKLEVILRTDMGKDPVLRKKGDISTYSISQNISHIDITSGETSFLGLGGKKEPFFYTLSQTGYSRVTDMPPASQGMEITRTYMTIDGKPIDAPIQIGDTVEAVISVRSYDDQRIENVAILDLLPGGLVLDAEGEAQGSTLFPEHVDRREDRILIFSDIQPYERVYRYRLRAITKGSFHVPPPFAESMYDLTKKARGSASTIVIEDEGQ